MAKANHGNRLKKELENKLEGVFAQLKRGQEYLDSSLTLTACQQSLCLDAKLLIEGPEEDKRGKDVRPSWKKFIGKHASKILDALLETIKQFYARHQDSLVASARVYLRYQNFGVRRQRIRIIGN